MAAPADMTVTPAGPTHDAATRWQRTLAPDRRSTLSRFRSQPYISQEPSVARIRAE